MPPVRWEATMVVKIALKLGACCTSENMESQGKDRDV
jgi:hypothetical protein